MISRRYFLKSVIFAAVAKKLGLDKEIESIHGISPSASPSTSTTMSKKFVATTTSIPNYLKRKWKPIYPERKNK